MLLSRLVVARSVCVLAVSGLTLMAASSGWPVVAADDSEARWRSGEVLFAGQWTTPDRVAELITDDPQQVAYRERRRQAADTPEDHFKMAQWCRARGLDEEYRAHLAVTAHLNPNDERAFRALGMVQHQGRWMTQAESAEYRQREAESLKAFSSWRTKIVKLRSDLASTDPGVQNSATAQLRAIRDPFAIPAMEELLSRDSEPAAMLAVDVVGQILHKAATRSLVRHAVWHSSPRVRAAAVEQLRHRDPHFYVGDLIQLLRPASFQQTWTTLPNGSAAYVTLLQDFDRNYLTVSAIDPNLRYGGLDTRAGAGPENRKYPAQRAVEAVDARNQFRLENASAALKQTTGQDFGADQRAWLNWWQDVSYVSPSQSSPPYRTTVARYERIGQFAPTSELGSHSCFVAGTPVWTRRGLVPIDHVQLGDLVLAKNIVTGELGYQPVVDRTIRHQKATLNLEFDGEAIGVTPGHVMWSATKGWIRARDFQAGDLAGSSGRAVPVAGVSEGRSDFAYNLVVARFSTYFVGQSRILVHDFTPVADTLPATVPSSGTNE